MFARRIDDGMWAAIQCKFYEPTTRLTKAGLDSFFDASGRFLKTESGPDHFGSRIIVSTTDHWSLDAEAALANDHISTGRIGTALRILNLRLTGMSFSPAQRSKINLSQCEAFEPRPYPSEAIDSAMERSASLDHGKLIMACGTGRIFTALRFTERVDDENGVKACILFLGPSISLLSQTPREWTAQGGGYVFVKSKSEFLSETLEGRFRHGYWAHQLVLVGLIAARPKLLLIVW